MISYHKSLKTFRLDTKKSTYLISVNPDGRIFHSWYGSRISDDDVTYLQPCSQNASFSADVPEGGYTIDTKLCEYPCNGAGDFRISALSVRGATGASATDIRYVTNNFYKGKKPLAGLPASYDNGNDCDTLEITAVDSLTGATVILSYSVFEEYDAIARSVKIINKGDKPFEIERVLSGCYDFSGIDFDFIHLYGAHAKERQLERVPVHHGIFSVGSKRGASSHNHNPFVALASKGTDEDHGQAYGFCLLYSGNFIMECEQDTFGNTRLLCGINPTDFGWTLKPGEEFTSPEVISVYSENGLGQMSRNFHKIIRNNICRGKYKTSRRPILVNNWEATYFDFDSDKLVAIAKDAAELGIEMLVMDDGWFGVRNSDNCSLGDWFVNEKKIKGGLQTLVERVKALGLKFGIWFEPEMISPDSELYRAHPDWCIHVEGRDRSLGRQQSVLDMSRKDVRDNIFDQMSAILKSADIPYVKWDFNRNITEAGSALLPPEQGKEFFHRYVLGVYELLERLLTAFPDLLLEGCSGGGGRFDAGMLYYSPQIWTSDNTDAMDRCFIQWGTSYVYPASSMSAHVSAVPNHQTARTESIVTRGDVAMGGAFGYELDLNKLKDTDKEAIKKQVEDYKKYYELVNYGDYYRLISPFETETHCAWEYVKEDASEALVTFVVIQHKMHREYKVFPKGLDPDSRYLIEGRNFSCPAELSGDTIMNAGIPVRLYRDQTSAIIHLIEK